MRGPVSESNEHPDQQEPEDVGEDVRLGDIHEDGGALADPGAPDDPDDVGDLDDFDTLGIDGIVAQMTGDEPPRASRRRPVWVSVVVILACLYPLVSIWGDFRFWLRDDEPEPLGDAAALFEPGAPTPSLADRYVSIEGTPDVQWATVLTKKSGAKVSYLRVIEGGGRLFAAVPRPEGKSSKTPEYPSGFVGRVSRFGDATAFDWIARLYAQEGVTQLFDLPVDALEGLASTGVPMPVTAASGERVEVEAGDTLRLVTKPDDARILLGVESFPDAEAAEAAVAELGYPYISLGEGRTDLRRYVARIPEAKRDDARGALLAKVAKEVDPNDPKEGVSVFGLSATYITSAEALSVQQGAVVFPYGDNTTAPGYVEQGGVLVEATLIDDQMRVPLTSVHHARVEKAVQVDPDGFLVEVGVTPGSQRKWGLAWLLVLAVALTNVVVLVGSLRRRAV